MEHCILIQATIKTKEEADTIAQALLKEELVACVNIIPHVSSYFIWQNKIQQAEECILIAKTAEVNASEAIERIRSLHSYEIPAIIALPISNGHKPYLSWIYEATI